MGKRDAAPTLGWVISSHIWKWVTIFLLLLLTIFVLFWYRVFAIVTYDCSQPYTQSFRFGSKHIDLRVVDKKEGCAQ